MGELPGRNVAKTGKGKNWKSRGRGKEKNMVVEYIPLLLTIAFGHYITSHQQVSYIKMFTIPFSKNVYVCI